MNPFALIRRQSAAPARVVAPPPALPVAVNRLRGYGHALLNTLDQVVDRNPRAPVALRFRDWAIFGDRYLGFWLDEQRLYHLSLDVLASKTVTDRLALAVRKPVFVVRDPSLGFLYVIQLQAPPRSEPIAAPTLPTLIDLPDYQRPAGALPTALGVATDGPIVLDLAQPYHILVGGLTQHGKTALVHALLIGAARFAQPDRLRLALVDPKGQFVNFARLPHLMTAIADDEHAALKLVGAVISEMEKRRTLFKELEAIDIEHYNQLCGRYNKAPLPHIVLVIDEGVELSLTAGKAWMPMIKRIVSRAASAGIRMVFISTSATSDIIDANFRQMFGIRVAVKCTERQQSAKILGDQIYAAADLPDMPGRFAIVLPNRGTLIGQGYYLSREALRAATAALSTSAAAQPDRPTTSTLSELERDLVLYALTRLDGAFKLRELSAAFKGRISMPQLRELAGEWERKHWLLPQPAVNASRPVSRVLLDLVGWVDAPKA